MRYSHDSVKIYFYTSIFRALLPFHCFSSQSRATYVGEFLHHHHIAVI
ncbi:hypothetical protein V6Z11_A10G214200 [Gossypium hirsutum]